jgi:2-polyprenyl-3-methyl-5-hydroxy-6-metoxy-1,4-benzoquinol methylase
MDRTKAREFVDDVMELSAGALTIGLLAVADRSGLLRTMANLEPSTISQIAEESGVNARYVAEIVSGLTTAGIVEYDPSAGTFSLPAEHAEVLANDESPYSLTGWLDMIPAAMAQIDAVTDAAISGGGVPFESFGDTMIRGIARAGAPSARLLLPRRWLNAMPDVVERLTEGGTVADFGCGSGAAATALAESYPESNVLGVDISAESIAGARLHDHPPNVEFAVGGSDLLVERGGFDLVTALDVIHDLDEPVAILSDIRHSLSETGSLLIMEPRIDDHLENNLGAHGTVLYGISTLHCMTQSLANGGAGIGAAAGPSTIEQLAKDAGFESFVELPIDNPFSAFYRVS